MMRNDNCEECQKKEKPETIWFSMWFLSSISSFGLTIPFMFFVLVERINRHLKWFSNMEKQALQWTREERREFIKPRRRSALFWAFSTVFVVPVFLIMHILTKDLLLHEKQEYALLKRFYPERTYKLHNIDEKRLLALTLATFGLGIIYWTYVVVNVYNNHFRDQWQIEELLAKF